jgi:hypothetical protein
MQTNKELDLRVVPGAPVSAIPRKWFIFVNNVLKYFRVKNGRLDVRNDKWTLICGDSGGWSGYWWYGGELNGPSDITQISGQYFGCNLRTGQTQFADQTSNTNEIEWRYIADKTTINEGTEEEEDVYTLSNRTTGDIVFRVT